MRKTTVLTMLVLMICSASLHAQNDTFRISTDVQILEGTILDTTCPMARILVGDEEVIVHLGPLWYWQERDYHLEKDENCQVVGDVEIINGVRHVYPMFLEMEDRQIELASEDGVPHWSRGRWRFGAGGVMEDPELQEGFGHHGQAESAGRNGSAAGGSAPGQGPGSGGR